MSAPTPSPRCPRKAAVVGTGLMGPGIAAALAGAGIAVTLTGRRLQGSQDAARRADHLTGPGAAAIVPRPLDAAAFCDVDLVVETVTEDLLIKQEVLALVESWCSEEAVLATNTSSLTLSELRGALQRPNLLGGLHFLNPAHLTRLVEVVAPKESSPVVAESLRATAVAMGKTTILVQRDIPGLVWNRLQAAILRECLYLVETGVADLASIDLAVSDGLAPRWLAAGPLGTVDLGGAATFRAMASKVFPELFCGAAPSGLLADGDGEFYNWDDRARAGIEELRDEALRYSTRLSERRRRLLSAHD